MTPPNLSAELGTIAKRYDRHIKSKVFSDEVAISDPLMEMLGITPEMKKDNRQFWGRTLGCLWEDLVASVVRTHRPDFQEKLHINGQSPADLRVGSIAIDTKYRIGSGDNKTLKGLSQNGALLKSLGYQPVCLILRPDSTRSAIGWLKKNWQIIADEDAFAFIEEMTNFDLKAWMNEFKPHM